MNADMEMPTTILRRLAKTDTQNFEFWKASARAARVGPGKNPLKWYNPGRVNTNCVTTAQAKANKTSPASSYFQPDHTRVKNDENSNCTALFREFFLVYFNDFFPGKCILYIAVTESFHAAHVVQSLSDKTVVHKL